MDSPITPIAQTHAIDSSRSVAPSPRRTLQNLGSLSPTRETEVSPAQDIETNQPLDRFSPTHTLPSSHESTMQTSLSVSTLNHNTNLDPPSPPAYRPSKAADANEWPNRLFTTPPPSAHLIMADLPLQLFSQTVLQGDLLTWQSPSQAPTLSLPSSSITTGHISPQNLVPFLPEMLNPVNERILEDCTGNIPGYAEIIRPELLHLQTIHGELVQADSTPNGDLQYHCKVCGHPSNKPGQRRWDISPHVLTHSRVLLRPWRCSCGRCYLRSHDQRRHSDKCSIDLSRRRLASAHQLRTSHPNATSGYNPGISRPAIRPHPYLPTAGNRPSVGVGPISISDQDPSRGAPYSSPIPPYSIPTATSVSARQPMPYRVVPGQPIPPDQYDQYPNEQYATDPSTSPASLSMPRGHGYVLGFTGGARMGPYDPSRQPLPYVVPSHANTRVDPPTPWLGGTEEVSEKGSMLSMCDDASKDLEASKRTRCMPGKGRADSLRLTAVMLILLALCAAFYFWRLYSIL